MFLLVIGVVLIVGAVAAQAIVRSDDDDDRRRRRPPRRARRVDAAGRGRHHGPADHRGRPTPRPRPDRPGFATPGLLTFRGSPTRSYYGQGPVPRTPRSPGATPGDSGNMCAESSVGSETKVWCGSGWTGQPSVFEQDGRTWVVFGAYDRAVHFVDFETGEDIIPPFPTGDIIKGSVTIDPDGFPLVYSGSRDNYMHVIPSTGPSRSSCGSSRPTPSRR